MVKTRSNLLIVFGRLTVATCIAQGFYYPILESPQTVVEWWQIGPLAGIGLIVGLPVFLVWESYFQDVQMSELALWVLTLVYASMIYFVVRAIWTRFQQRT